MENFKTDNVPTENTSDEFANFLYIRAFKNFNEHCIQTVITIIMDSFHNVPPTL